MRGLQNNTDFRARLPGADTDWRLAKQQVELLAVEHPHSIVLAIEEPPGDGTQYRLTNCFTYAFGLFSMDEYWEAYLRDHEVFPTGIFVEEWLLPVMQELTGPDAVGETVAVYFADDGRVVHAGRVEGDIITSKWAAAGHLWHHGVMELPLPYGNAVRYFAAPAVGDVFDMLVKFAKSEPEVRYPGLRGTMGTIRGDSRTKKQQIDA